MFECTIELLHPSRQREKEPGCYVVSKNRFDPGFKVGDELEINDWQIWGQSYTFNVKVVRRKYEIHPPDKQLVNQYGYPNEAASEGLLLLRIFVEAEDRDQLVELNEAIEKMNPE